MSDDARTLLFAPMADGLVIRDTLACLPDHSIAESLGARDHYVPLSERTSDELLTRAEELRGMAQTATTTDVVRALVTLADRYATLAAKRRTEESLDRRG